MELDQQRPGGHAERRRAYHRNIQYRSGSELRRPERERLAPGEYVLIRVSDTGTGMSEDMLERAFEPFVTNKRVGDGHGLGLSTALGFIKQSGGDITIDSEVGCGTTVNVYLPTARAVTSTPATIPVEPQAPSAAPLVLLVEDDPGIRRAANRILSESGCQVIEAETGAQALAMLNERAGITLLFTDVVMPGGMSGPELVAHARQRNRDLRVLYTSGYTGTAVLNAGLEDEVEPLLNKPYRRDELTQAVREILEG